MRYARITNSCGVDVVSNMLQRQNADRTICLIYARTVLTWNSSGICVTTFQFRFIVSLAVVLTYPLSGYITLHYFKATNITHTQICTGVSSSFVIRITTLFEFILVQILTVYEGAEVYLYMLLTKASDDGEWPLYPPPPRPLLMWWTNGYYCVIF